MGSSNLAVQVFLSGRCRCIFTSFLANIPMVVLLFLFLSCGTKNEPIVIMKNRDSNQGTPPYIAKTSNFMGLQFEVDSDAAQKLLPQGITATVNGNGFATAGLEIYTTDQVFGIPSYSIAFVTLSVTDYRAATPAKGNWAIWGVMDNLESLQYFKEYFNFPYHYEKDILITTVNEERSLVIGNQEKGGVSLRLQSQKESPVLAQGLAPLYSQLDKGEILRTDIPWLAEGYQAVVLSLEINPGNDKALKILKQAKPVYAQISSNVFSYSKPVQQGIILKGNTQP